MSFTFSHLSIWQQFQVNDFEYVAVEMCRINLILDRENESSFLLRLCGAKDLKKKIEASNVSSSHVQSH